MILNSIDDDSLVEGENVDYILNQSIDYGNDKNLFRF